MSSTSSTSTRTNSFSFGNGFGQPTQSPPPGFGEGSNGGPGGIFSTSGGPPLILVFLAAGLLVGALAALIILRRFYPDRRLRGRLAQIARDDERNRQKRQKELGEKPVLWDVYAASDTLDDDLEQLSGNLKPSRRWDRILPITGKFVPDEPFQDDDSSSSPHTTRPTRLPPLPKFLMKKVKRPSPPESLPVDDLEKTAEGRLQVAVAIVMPRPPNLSLSSDGEPELDYCLGLVDAPWKETVTKAGISKNA